MKRKIFIIIGILVILIWYNINSIFSFYENYLWIQSFNNNNFKNALTGFDNALWFEIWDNQSKKILFNKANSLYKLWDFEKAKDIFKSLKDINNDFFINHNLWNSYFKIWEKNQDESKKLKSWNDALIAYENALSVKYDDETKKNYDFVKEKIKNINEKNEKENEEKNQQKDKQTWSWNAKQEQDLQNQEKKDLEQDWWEGEAEEFTKNEEWKEWSQWPEKQENKSSFSEQEQKEIQDYTKGLKQIQKDNQKYFNRSNNYNKWNDPNDIFWNLFNDPFFNNNPFEQESNEKDW